MNTLKTRQDPSLDGISGAALTPCTAAYDAARSVWNGMIDRKPGSIVRCRNADDVIAAVGHARANDLPIAIRAGGHNVAGHAVCEDGIMIDLSEMRSVTVDPARRITIAHIRRVTRHLARV